MQQPGRNDIWKQLKTHVNSSHGPPLAADETAKAPVEAIALDETLVELAEVDPLPAEDDPLAAEDDPLPAEELDTIPLDPEGVPGPLTVEASPPAPPAPVGSRSSSLP